MKRNAYFFTLFFSCFVSTALYAQEFKLRWHGQSYFSLNTPKGKTIAFDPHAIAYFGKVELTADIILCSHRHNDHAQPEVIEKHATARIFHGLNESIKGRPPEWNKIDEKVGAIQIRTVPTYHDTMNGMQRGKNSAFVVDAEGLKICHLGDLGHELDAAQINAIGEVDILLIPCGGIYTINGEKAKAIALQIKPKLYVVPMHFGFEGYDDLLPVDEFLDEQKNVKKMQNTNELKIATDAKAGDTFTVVVLGFKPTEEKKP